MAAQAIDLSAGLVPKQQQSQGSIDLSGGLVPLELSSNPPGAPNPQVEPKSSVLDKILGFAGTTGADVGRGIIKGSYKAPPNLPGLMIAKMLGLSTPETELQGTGEQIGGALEQTAEMVAGGGALKAGATSLASRLPFLAKFAAPVARIGAEALNTGMSAAGHGQPIGTSAAVGAAGGAVGEALSAVAPSVVRRALSIGGKDAKYGQTPAEAILENTSGIRPATVARQAGQKASSLTRQVESGVASATQRTMSGQAGMISTDGAHQVLDDALSSAPRNATAYKSKVSSLRDLLNLDDTGRREFTPDEILEMKRGIGKEISSWDSTARRNVTPVTKKLYRALDTQLDAAAPGNRELNQRIGSLITGAKRADATAGRRSGVVTQLLARGVPATAGGALGYAEGGRKGAAVGAVAGSLLATPAGQMALARLLRAGLPKILARGLVASGYGQGTQPTKP